MALSNGRGFRGKYVVVSLILLVLVVGATLMVIRQRGMETMQANVLPLTYSQALQDLNEGAYEFAVEHFTTVIDRGGRPEAWGFRGETYLRLSQYEKAEADFREAIRRDPKRPANFGGLAVALVRQGRYQEALSAVDKAIALVHQVSAREYQSAVPRTGDALDEMQRLRKKIADKLAEEE